MSEKGSTGRRYQQDLPRPIQRKISLFSKQEKLMADLRAQLETLEREHGQLELELVPYLLNSLSIQPSSAPKARISNAIAVHRLPEEILCMVFEYYLNSHHNRIRRLLLVCKRWHHLVMNSPKLWTRINLQHPERLLETYSQLSDRQYITACVERSQGLSLDVTLDFGSFPTASKWLQGKIQSCILASIDPDDRYCEFVTYTKNAIFFESPKYEAEVDTALQHISGKDNEHMKRWSALHISFNKSSTEEGPEFGWMLFRRLTGHTPNLKTLQIEGLLEYPFPISHPEWLSQILPDLSSITQLDFTQSSFGFLKLPPGTLQHLRFYYHSLNSLHDIQWSLFSSLHTLIMNYRRRENVTESNQDDPPFTICLPSLHKLQLGWISPSISIGRVTFDCPLLEEVVMNNWTHPGNLPVLSPHRVRWVIDRDFDMYFARPGKLTTILDTAVMSFASARHWSFSENLKPIVLSAIPHYLKEQKLSFASGIDIEHYNGDIERVDLDKLRAQ